MTELTDRMRTCAAHIEAKAQDDVAMPPEVSRDAVSLLREAADTLEEAGVGMVVVDTQTAVALGIQSDAARVAPEELVPRQSAVSDLVAHWVGDDLKPIPNAPISKNACPECDSRTTKTVHIVGRSFELECPVCGLRWRRR